MAHEKSGDFPLDSDSYFGGIAPIQKELPIGSALKSSLYFKNPATIDPSKEFKLPPNQPFTSGDKKLEGIINQSNENYRKKDYELINPSFESIEKESKLPRKENHEPIPALYAADLAIDAATLPNTPPSNPFNLDGGRRILMTPAPTLSPETPSDTPKSSEPSDPSLPHTEF